MFCFYFLNYPNSVNYYSGRWTLSYTIYLGRTYWINEICCWIWYVSYAYMRCFDKKELISHTVNDFSSLTGISCNYREAKQSIYIIRYYPIYFLISGHHEFMPYIAVISRKKIQEAPFLICCKSSRPQNIFWRQTSLSISCWDKVIADSKS
jgi:hypothetical protein